MLIKVIQTEDPNLLNNITEATNSQTAVTSRDLRSNDTVQRYIEEHLRALGYYYEARTSKYISDEEVKSDKRIDAATAAQVWLAFRLQRPYESLKKSQIFKDPILYSEVFPTNLDVKAYLNAYLLFKHVYKIGKTKKDEFPFVHYAKFNIMAMLGHLGIRNIEDFENNQEKYKNVLDTIQAQVIKEVGKKGFKGYGAFFNQPALLKKLVADYETAL